MIKIDCSMERVLECISKYDEEEELKEKVLEKVFQSAPNTDEQAELIRVTLLNSFYSTRLNNAKPKASTNESRRSHADVESMAKHIAVKKDLYYLIHSSNEHDRLEAFNYIAYMTSEFKTSNSYAAPSFASKYCSWCNPVCYPIMDSYSREMLYHINLDSENKFFEGSISKDGMSYEEFCAVHEAFRVYLKNKHNGREYSAKDIDKYLWYYGKNHMEKQKQK